MTSRAPDEPKTGEALAQLAGALGAAVEAIRRAGDGELGLAAARLEALRQAFTRPARVPLRDSEAGQWLHALRDATNAICGWVAILRQTADHAVRRRAAAAIGRNINDLEQLLAKPPA